MASTLKAYNDRVQQAVADLPADSDYNTAAVRKFVEIKVLDVFEIITKIFNAFRQTHYADAGNVGAGWYKCMVAFEDQGEGGVTQTDLEEWYVKSTLVSQGGSTINRVFVKINQQDGSGLPSVLRAQVDIDQAPTENSDGTLANLGAWQIRALQGAGASHFFATAEVLQDGTTKMTVEDNSDEQVQGGQRVTGSTKAIIFRSQTDGYGAVEYPNWNPCHDPGSGVDCSGGPPIVTVHFAYNSNYLSVEVVGDSSHSFDRQDEHEIVHRYAIFNSADGTDVQRDRTFGFPVRFTATGDHRFGWYGAWQDRHQLWAQGDPVTDGTTVARNDVPQNQTPPSYTTKSFPGVLTRIELAPGSVAQLDGIPAEIFLFNNFRLKWNIGASRWDQCNGDDGMGGCASQTDFTSRLGSLALAGDGSQKQIFINHCGPDGMGGFACVNYVYQTASPSGFYVAQLNSGNGQWTSTGVALDTSAIADGFDLFCSIGGRTYIEYTGEFAGPTTTTGWVERTLASFDQQTWTPTFVDGGDTEFFFEQGREYFISNRGVNLRVTKVSSNGDAADYQVFMDVNTVAKPSSDLGDVYPDGTVLAEPWNPDANSKYALNTDSTSDHYLLLEYHDVSSQDQSDGRSVGDLVTKDIWGLKIDGDTSAFGQAPLYNWEYKADGDFQGGVTYLLDSNSNFVLLSAPIRFESISLASTNDIVQSNPSQDWLSYSMVYDGFLHGLPDTWWDLEKVNFTGDQVPSVLAKNVRIPDGTELTDSDANTYFVKAVDVGIFLGLITAFPLGEEPDLSQTGSISLDNDLPTFTAPTLDTTLPTSAPLLYIEGIPAT